MSKWWDIKIGNYIFFENSSAHFFEWYFQKSDRKIVSIEGRERYIYETTSSVMLKRLALDGCDRQALEKEFEEAKLVLLDELELAREHNPKAGGYASAFQNKSLDDWINSLRKVVEQNLGVRYFDEGDEYEDPAMDWMLTYHHWHTELAWDFPCLSMDCYALAVLLALAKEEYVRLDCTELVGSKKFTAFDDYLEYCEEETSLFSVFKNSVGEILLLGNTSPEHPTLAKFLYSGVITAMETYLSDTLKRMVTNHAGIRRRYVENAFDKDKKFPLNRIFAQLDDIDKDIRELIDRTSFHNVKEVSRIYEAVLLVKFPAEYSHSLRAAVDNRHDIVHRNGRSLSGESKLYTFKEVERLSALVLTILKDVDMQIQSTLVANK